MRRRGSRGSKTAPSANLTSSGDVAIQEPPAERGTVPFFSADSEKGDSPRRFSEKSAAANSASRRFNRPQASTAAAPLRSVLAEAAVADVLLFLSVLVTPTN